MFIDADYIQNLLNDAKTISNEEITYILDKASSFEGLSHKEVAALLMCEDSKQISRIYEVAGKIKEHIYGNRIVLFAPLYISDYCVNRCKYCGYNCSHKFERKKLTMDELRQEVEVLVNMGHKRLALEAGEDPINCPIDYVLECIKTIYNMKFKNGEIRRVNVNIAATTVENYAKLKEIGIGTYVLFQETYHKPTYETQHISGPKANYEYHLTAFDRAMEGGIDDVGGGVLFGLYDWKFEVMGLMLHNEHLEKTFGVGFHTISMPRIRKAIGADKFDEKYLPSDEDFKKLVAIIRLAVPFTGMIISTRESAEMRKTLIKMGISQVSGGSSVGVGSYSHPKNNVTQFELEDDRSASDVIGWLMDEGLIPSFCTACYRMGRTGDRFMELAKSGNIKYVCHPNALMTLYEYMLDYGNEELLKKAKNLIETEIPKINNIELQNKVRNNLIALENGNRDIYF